MTDSDIIDTLKKLGGLESDEQLAGKLGISKGNLSHVRTGRTKLGPIPMLKALDMIGYSFASDALDALTTEGFAKRLIEKNKKLGNIGTEGNFEKEDTKRNRSGGRKTADE